MGQLTDYLKRQRQQQQAGGFGLQTQPGNPDFSLATSPSSQAQFPAAAAEQRIQDTQGRATNRLGDAFTQGFDTSAPEFDPLNEASQQGFTERALTLGESLLGWVDGPRQAVNLLIQDLAGGQAEEGSRNPNFGDYWNTLWGGMEDTDGFFKATGLNPRSGSQTLDMFGWSEEESFAGRFGRGIADFSLQILTDPLTYVTFGLSGLGKKAARGAFQGLQRESIDAIMPILRRGTVDDAALMSLTPYQRHLVKNLDPIVNEFQADLLRKAERFGGDLPPDVKRDLARYLGRDEDPWANITELALANRITRDVGQPLIARNFKAINNLARAELPLWARGGARISVPFTQNNLRHGAQIPGTIGIGKSAIGDPLRGLSTRMKGYSNAYNSIANKIESAKNAFDQQRPILNALQDGSWDGWQFHMSMDALDTIHNEGAKELIRTVLNSRFQAIRKIAEANNLDINEINSLIMNRLEKADIDNVSLAQAEKIFGPSGTGRDLTGDWGRLYPDLDKEVNEVAAFLRETYNGFHKRMGALDPSVKKKYIDGYTPHKMTDIARRLTDELSGKGAAPPRGEWAEAELAGSPGKGLFARIMALGKGGRLETNMGGSRYLNEREYGKMQALTLLDDGVMMLDEQWADNFLRTQTSPLLAGGEVDIAALETRYVPASSLNEILEPVYREQAQRNGVVVPADWDGKIFSEDPFEVAADYMGNMDEAIRMQTAMQTFRAAGLAMHHSTALDPQDVIQALFENVVKHTEAIQVAKFGRPDPDNHMAPVSWLKKIIDPMDYDTAKLRAGGTVPDVAPGMAPMFHGSKGSLPRNLEALEGQASIGDGNLFGPALYTSTDKTVAETYTAGGKLNAIEWQGDKPPNILDIEGPVTPEFRSALGKLMDNVEAAKNKSNPDMFNPEFPENGPGPEFMDQWETLRAVANGTELPRGGKPVTAEFIYDTLKRLSANMGRIDGIWSDIEIPQRFNIFLRNEGIDGLRYEGGLRTGNKRHEAIAWLRMEKLKPANITPIEEKYILEPAIIDATQPAGQRYKAPSVKGTREEFVESIREGGVKEPLNVGIDPEGNVILINGHNRLLAAEELGIEELPIRIVPMGAVDDLTKSTGVNVSHYLRKDFVGEDVAIDPLSPNLAEEIAVASRAGQKTLAETFDVLPWDPSPFVTEKNILKGTFTLGDADVPMNVQGALRGTGMSSKQIADTRNMLHMALMSRDEFVKLSPLAQSPRLMAVPLEGSNFKVTLSANGELDITFRSGMNLAEKRDAIEAAISKLDTEFKTGLLKGKLTAAGMRDIASKAVDETTSRVLYRYLNRKLAALPPSVSEWITKEPAELVQTRALYDYFEEEINSFVTDYAALQTRSGQLITDPKQLKLTSANEVQRRINGLREAADKLGDAGYDIASKIMRGVDDLTSVGDPDFVNPSRFGLAGPAVEGMAVQKDLALFLRNVARNSAMMYTPEGIAAAKIATKNGLRWWRAMATIARPSFHIRNLVGGAYMNLIHGVSNSNYAIVANNAPIVRKALRAGKSLDEAFETLPANAKELFRDAWEDNIMSGFASTEFRKLTAGQKRERLAWAKVNDIDDFVLTRMGSHFMESIEDLLRVSLYARYYDPKNPGSRFLAKEMVNATHFDYVNLTPLETKLKSFIPFFVWTRRNLPRQIQLAVENPRYVQKYRAMMQSMNDNLGGEDPANLPEGDSFSAFAAGTNYYVNPNTPFWARVMIDPDLPIQDLINLPSPNVGSLVDYANELLGPHISTLVNVNEQREFGDVNAPAPFNAVLKSLAAVGLYDETMEGDVRMPYFMRSILETALPFGREIIDPLTGGPSDPNRQQRLGISEDDGTLEAMLKNIAGVGLSGVGVKLTSPADVRGVAARTNEELDQLIQELRLQGAFPASEG